MSDEKEQYYKTLVQEKIAKVQKCQADHALASCMPCEKFVECPTRDEFVQATFAKMNKGEQGGFEF